MNDRFASMSAQEQRAYMAEALGCDPGHPGGWPNRIIDRLVLLRLQQGVQAYYLELGRLLTPEFH